MRGNKLVVVIADPSEDYAIKLEDKFLRMMRDSIDLHVITDEAYFHKYFASPIHVDVALVSELFDFDELANQDIASLFYLSEDESLMQATTTLVEETGSRGVRVYKYTSLSQVFNQTMGGYSGLMQPATSRQEPRSILLFSPVGGSGKTTLAVGVATCLQESGYKVLFVDAEYQQGLGKLFGQVKDAPYSFAMSMAQEHRDPYSEVKDSILHGVVDVLPPLGSNIMTYGIKFDAYCALIEGALRSGDYNYVVIDTDCVLNLEKINLVQIADALLVPVTQDDLALRKTAGFLNSLDTNGRSKCHLVRNDPYNRGDEVSPTDNSSLGAGIKIEGTVRHYREMPLMNANDLAGMDDVKAITYLVR